VLATISGFLSATRNDSKGTQVADEETRLFATHCLMHLVAHEVRSATPFRVVFIFVLTLYMYMRTDGETRTQISQSFYV
jgi:hypothetical protein